MKMKGGSDYRVSGLPRLYYWKTPILHGNVSKLDVPI